MAENILRDEDLAELRERFDKGNFRVVGAFVGALLDEIADLKSQLSGGTEIGSVETVPADPALHLQGQPVDIPLD